jgi:hypothetical protein
MAAAAAGDIGADAPPRSSDDHAGSEAQEFLVEVVARRSGEERRASARGRDIYGFSAPLVVEATERVLRGEVARAGAVSAGEAFPAAAFLGALPLDGLTIGGG